MKEIYVIVEVYTRDVQVLSVPSNMDSNGIEELMDQINETGYDVVINGEPYGWRDCNDAEIYRGCMEAYSEEDAVRDYAALHNENPVLLRAYKA